VPTDVTDHIALFLTAAALLLTSVSVLSLAAARRAQRQLIASLSSTVGRLVAAVELIERVLDRLADEARVAYLLADLTGAWDLDDALQHVADVATRVARAEGALVGVRGPAEERRVGSFGDIPPTETTVAWPFDGVQAMTFATLHHAGSDTRSTAYGAAVPLLSASNESIGVLTVFFDSNEAAVQGLAVLERVAAAATPVLAAALAAARPELADRPPDVGTGLPARAAFHEGLAREAARSRRDGIPLAVALVAIDAARSPNEREASVDDLLRNVVETIDAIRPPDSLLYRIGADALGLVLPGRTADGARGIAAALRTAQHERGATTASLRVATGIAELLPTDDDAVALAARAQAALDAAKRARLRPADESG
jgi:GGDEF domain-containing protein